MAKITCPRNNTLIVNIDLDVDITGATVFFMAKSSYDDADSNAKISGSVSSHDDAVNGLTHFEFGPPDDSQTNLPVGIYYYDIKVVYMDGTEESWPPDKLKITKVVKIGDT